jgi:glutamate-ammonia-ligase adenylyltransferase
MDERSRLRLARCLGFESWETFEDELGHVRLRVHDCIEGLRSGDARTPRWTNLFAAIDEANTSKVQSILEGPLHDMATKELARDLVHLGMQPDVLLGMVVRDRAPIHAESLVDALVESADPEQAARSLCAWSSHRSFKPVHASALREPPALLRRFVTALGGSAFLGDLIVRHPELAEHVLFSRGMPSTHAAAKAVDHEVQSLDPNDRLDPESVAGAIRRAKIRVTLEVVLADIAEEVGVVDVTRVLSALADACVQSALHAVAGSRDATTGMCVLSVGKLGGEELGYGSDLDVLFVFEPHEDEDENEVMVRRVRQAQKAIRVLSEVHEQGPGYELDTRLRPSGSQGVLVTSLRAFARYHGIGAGEGATGLRAAAWERQTLLRARFTAGDAALGERVLSVAQKAVYEAGPPDLSEVHRLRLRMEKELGREKGGRFDLKLGRGGLVDIEFAVQAMQMQHSHDASVRTTHTLEAIDALDRCGAIQSEDAARLREGYLFLRKLEQRLHVVHNASIHLLEAEAPGLLPLARRMGLTGAPGRSAANQLMDRYTSITSSVRTTYLKLMGVE